MKLKCVFNESSFLPIEQRGRHANFNETYDLTVGAEYLVLGMMLWENILKVFVRDDWGGPCYARAALFEPASQRLPSHWRFALCSGIHATGREIWTEPCGALWGYEELVDNPEHFTLLVERDPDALAIFEREYQREEAASL